METVTAERPARSISSFHLGSNIALGINILSYIFRRWRGEGEMSGFYNHKISFLYVARLCLREKGSREGRCDKFSACNNCWWCEVSTVAPYAPLFQILDFFSIQSPDVSSAPAAAAAASSSSCLVRLALRSASSASLASSAAFTSASARSWTKTLL